MGSLAPPAVHTLDAVTYRPEPPTLDVRPLHLAVGVALFCAAAAFGTFVFPAIVLWAVLAAFTSRLRPPQRTEITLGQHRLSVHTAGDRRDQHLGATWEELQGAELVGQRLLLVDTSGRRIETGLYGTPPQLAWIVGEVNARIARHALPADEARRLDEGWRQLHRVLARPTS